MNLQDLRKCGLTSPTQETSWYNTTCSREGGDTNTPFSEHKKRMVVKFSAIMTYIISKLILVVAFLSSAQSAATQESSTMILLCLWIIMTMVFIVMITMYKNESVDSEYIKDCQRMYKAMIYKHPLETIYSTTILKEIFNNTLKEKAKGILFFEKKQPDWSHSLTGARDHKKLQDDFKETIDIFSKFIPTLQNEYWSKWFDQAKSEMSE
jgi:hypothetical protein